MTGQSAYALLLDSGLEDLLHVVLRKLSPDSRYAFRAACRSTKELSDAATTVLTIRTAPNLTSKLSARFPNVKSLSINLNDSEDNDPRYLLQSLMKNNRLLLQHLRSIRICLGGDWSRLSAELLQLMDECSSLQTVQFEHDFCDNLVLKHSWAASFDTQQPAAMANIRELLASYSGIHKAMGSSAWCNNLTSLDIDHLIAIPDDPILPIILPAPTTASCLKSLTLRTCSDAIPHFLNAPLTNLSHLSALQLHLQTHQPTDPASHPWHHLHHLTRLQQLSLCYTTQKYPPPPTAPFHIPDEWCHLALLTSLSLSVDSIHSLTPLRHFSALRQLSLSSHTLPATPSLPPLPYLTSLNIFCSVTNPPSPCQPQPCPIPSAPARRSLFSFLSCLRPKTGTHQPPLNPPTNLNPPSPSSTDIPCSTTPILLPLSTPVLANLTLANLSPAHLPSWLFHTTIRTLTLHLQHPSHTPALTPNSSQALALHTPSLPPGIAQPLAFLPLLHTLTLHNPSLSPPLLDTLSRLPNLSTLTLHSPILPLAPSPPQPYTLPSLATLTLHTPIDPPTLSPLHSPLDTLLLSLHTPSLTTLQTLTASPIPSLKSSAPACLPAPLPCTYTTLQTFLSTTPLLTPSSIQGLPTHLTHPTQLQSLATHHPTFLTTNPLTLAPQVNPHLPTSISTAAATAPLHTLTLTKPIYTSTLRNICAPQCSGHLTFLSFSMAAILPGDVCKALAQAKALRHLCIQDTGLFGAKTLARLAAACPRLEHLHLHAARLGTRALAGVSRFAALRALVLERYAGPAQPLAVIAALPPQARPPRLRHVAFAAVASSACDLEWFVTAMPISGMLWGVDRVTVVKCGGKRKDVLFELGSWAVGGMNVG